LQGHGQAQRGTELLNVFAREDAASDEPTESREKSAGETGNSRDGPGSTSFTGHSMGPKGGRLTFGKGTYYNVFAPNMEGTDRASIQARAWERLQQANYLEHALKQMPVENKAFEEKFAKMQDKMDEEKKKLEQERDEAEARLREKAAADVERLKSSVTSMVADVEGKVTGLQADAWEKITDRLNQDSRQHEQEFDRLKSKIEGANADRNAWVSEVSAFAKELDKKYATAESMTNSKAGAKRRELDRLVSTVKQAQAKYSKVSTDDKKALQALIAQKKAAEESDLLQRIAKLKAKLLLVFNGGEQELLKKIDGVQSGAMSKLGAAKQSFLNLKNQQAAPVNRALTNRANVQKGIVEDAESRESDAYKLYSQRFEELKAKIVALEATMKAKYRKMQDDILPAMKESLKGHRKDLEEKSKEAQDLLKEIREILQQCNWAIEQIKNRSGATVDAYLDRLEASYADLTARVNRLKVQYGDQVDP
jgi:flagellar motility protein MotE (MotC chaperone)